MKIKLFNKYTGVKNFINGKKYWIAENIKLHGLPFAIIKDNTTPGNSYFIASQVKDIFIPCGNLGDALDWKTLPRYAELFKFSEKAIKDDYNFRAQQVDNLKSI